jgi:hypothetical protein
MAQVLLIVFLVAIGPLAIRYGVDSRLDEVKNRRRWDSLG